MRHEMRFFRRAATVALIAGLLGAGYVWAYKTSSMGWTSPGNRPFLRVMGLNFNYTEKNGRRFTAFFRPLIEREYKQTAETAEEGTFGGSMGEGKFVMNRPGKMGIQLQFDGGYSSVIGGLERDTPMTVRYKRKAPDEKPFVYGYQLTAISVK